MVTKIELADSKPLTLPEGTIVIYRDEFSIAYKTPLEDIVKVDRINNTVTEVKTGTYIGKPKK